ncbi:MAG: hypothetical protein KDH18_25525 [Rhodoferax sp.]|nr:hypothetical protein [Rhodoferax sp.]MCB2040570.1 hypothetical protein [Rhodoferax sp.]
MALAGKGLVAIWNGIRDDMREDFFEWHPREHMVERLSIPGFLRGRRCIALDDSTEFLTLYEIRDTDVLLSETYKTRLLNPTPWSTKVLPGFTDNTRGACQILFSEGHAMGGFVLTLRFEAQPGREQELLDAVVREAMPRFAPTARITGAHCVRNDVALTGGNAGNQRGRVILLPDVIVLIEGLDAAAVKVAGERWLSDAQLQAWGAKPVVARGLYQLEYSIQALAA